MLPFLLLFRSQQAIYAAKGLSDCIQRTLTTDDLDKDELTLSFMASACCAFSLSNSVVCSFRFLFNGAEIPSASNKAEHDNEEAR